MMSRSITAMTSARPRPGTPNACSTATEPPSTKPSSTPEMVMIGRSALGSACRSTTRPSPSPFARLDPIDQRQPLVPVVRVPLHDPDFLVLPRDVLEGPSARIGHDLAEIALVLIERLL